MEKTVKHCKTLKQQTHGDFNAPVVGPKNHQGGTLGETLGETLGGSR
jgi:hypothetical protein